MRVYISAECVCERASVRGIDRLGVWEVNLATSVNDVWLGWASPELGEPRFGHGYGYVLGWATEGAQHMRR